MDIAVSSDQVKLQFNATKRLRWGCSQLILPMQAMAFHRSASTGPLPLARSGLLRARRKRSSTRWTAQSVRALQLHCCAAFISLAQLC